MLIFIKHHCAFQIMRTMLVSIITSLITRLILNKSARFPVALITFSISTSLVLFFVDLVQSIQITKFQVPAHVTLGEPVEMKCEFNLSKEEIIYTIKWYKEEVEFFRYEPGQRPKTKYFPVPGINVDKTRTNYSTVRLKEVDNYTSGTFVCEVSVDGSFITVENEKMMLVKSSGNGRIAIHNLYLIPFVLLNTFFQLRLK